jgi:hypothetical protein
MTQVNDELKATGDEKSRPAMQRVLYGRPCVNCRCYYESRMDACPVCHHKERMSAAQANGGRKLERGRNVEPPVSLRVDLNDLASRASSGQVGDQADKSFLEATVSA